MTNEETIFAAALARDSAMARAAYLDDACAGNDELRSSVEALLRAHERPAGILESPPTGGEITAANSLPSERIGSTVGPYKLLEQIGGGGMGVVYMAEQVHPIRRKVALKIIKPGMDSGQVIARFEAERQALTMMDHPNIAKVLDAGTTDAGRPYFVMELVKGIPITDYCDQARLTTRERLELFIPVCQAVQHAHQKGVIHRDLKPTNVLVTLHDAKPVPKVIDFGIAKAAGQVLTERTLFTNYAQMVGTPLYMSPEQAQISGLDVDTRSDVYSLGVLLYELLTGTTPFDKQRMREAAYDEMRRIIREEDPPHPSTRLSTIGEQITAISAHRHTDPKKLSQLVRGELDWIVMKALEKERARRYETANGLADDVQRYLNDEAVHACPPTRVYRLRKFARKHRLAISVIASFAALLLGATAVSSWQAVRATRAEHLARENERRAAAAAETSEQTARFLRRTLVNLWPHVAAGRDSVLVREWVDESVARIGDDLRGQPQVEAWVRALYADLYHRLQLPDEAEEEYRAALAAAGDNEALSTGIRSQFGWLLANQGKLAEGESMLRQALAAQRKVPGPPGPEIGKTLTNLGAVLRQRGRLEEAETSLREGIAISTETLGAADPFVVGRQVVLAGLLFERGQLTEAESLCRHTMRDTGSPYTPYWPGCEILSRLLVAQGRLGEAERYGVEMVSYCRRHFGDGHRETANAEEVLAEAVHAQGRYDEAERQYRHALELGQRTVGADHQLLARLRDSLGALLTEVGRASEAEPLLQDALASRRKALGEQHPEVARSMHHLARLRAAQGRTEEAIALFKQAGGMRRKLLGERHYLSGVCAHDLGLVLLALNRPGDAEPLLRDALAIRQGAFAEGNYQTAATKSALGAALTAQGKHEEAEALLLAAHTELGAQPPPPAESEQPSVVVERLLELYGAWGKPARVEAWRAKASIQPTTRPDITRVVQPSPLSE